MRSTVNPDATPLGVFLYADGAEARSRKHRYHPLLLFLGNFTLDAMRSQRGYVRLAHMSVLAKEDFPQVSDKESVYSFPIAWCLSSIALIYVNHIVVQVHKDPTQCSLWNSGDCCQKIEGIKLYVQFCFRW